VFRHLALIAVAALMAGCATTTPEERAQACAATDWQRYGENDGRLGVPFGDREEVFQDCGALGHPPDLEAYRAGRMAGLAVYCTAVSGYEVGYSGRRYARVCPPETEPDFLQGYRRGRKERPALAISPSIGIGVGSGGGVGVGVGIGLFNSRYWHGRCRWPYTYRHPYC